MNKKKLPHIIAVFTLAVFVVLMSACISEEGSRRIDDLIGQNGVDSFFKPPADSEIVLGKYSDIYSDSKNGTIASYYADQIRYRTEVQTQYYPENKISPKYAAIYLLEKARKEFPDIDVNELNVRSLMHEKTYYSPITLKENTLTKGFYDYEATCRFLFSGVVVRVKK